MKRNILMFLSALICSGNLAYAGTVDDYLCRMEMERAMRAHDDLQLHDAELQKANPHQTINTISGSVFDGFGLIGDSTLYIPSPPDTRSEDQKLDDRMKEIERERAALSRRRAEEAIWQAAKAKNADQHALAERLWSEAKQHCWRNP